MKILCLERDNTTHQSRDDRTGNSYRASFELFPFHEGKDHAVYKGMLNGRGPKRGSFCAVKARALRTGSETDWRSLIQISKSANDLASIFNNYLKRRVVCFTEPLVAQMNRVSDFSGVMKLFQPHEKKLKQKEFVILEDFIDGKFERFSSASGVSSESDLIQAFSHFTWHHTREFVICGLQGVNQAGFYSLTSPTLHSLSGRFGSNDSRFPGISEFFAHHVCNNICCNWDTPFKQINCNTLPYGLNSYLEKSVSPSAPPGYNTC